MKEGTVLRVFTESPDSSTVPVIDERGNRLVLHGRDGIETYDGILRVTRIEEVGQSELVMK
jgi:hypothetical protein